MSNHVMTVGQLRRQGIDGEVLRDKLHSKELHHLLGSIYCDRPPTTADKCRAVVLWREDAVLSHRTAAWVYGWLPEPDVIEAYVSSTPDDLVPSWLRLYVAPYDTYADDIAEAA